VTAQQLYAALDQLGIDYDVVQVFEGSRFIRVEVEEEEPQWEVRPVRMRPDLAEECVSIPAAVSFRNYDHLEEPVTYVTARELDGAVIGDDPAEPDSHAFCFVQLKDGRELYFVGADLEFD
jgi:hypothetical protein